MYYPPTFYLLLLFLFSLFYHFPYASSKQGLGWCETLYQCGEITADFPFWGGNRPQSCGHATLELRCNRNITSLNISNHVYNVLDIDKNSNTLRLARTDLLGHFCSATFNTTTLPPEIFELSSNYQDLNFFYHCNPGLHYVSSYTCPGRGPGSAYQNPNYDRSCQESFTVSVPKSYMPEEKELNLTRLEIVLRKGFEVKVMLACEECSSSAYEHYKRCSQPFSCGNQDGLFYPFWRPGREDCGHPDFKLDCSRGFADLILSSVMYRILEANYDSRIVRLARSDYIDSLCPLKPISAPLFKSLLPFAPDTKLLTIYYGCQNLSSFTTNFNVLELVCEHDKEGQTNYFVTRNISSLLPDKDNGVLFDDLRQNCERDVSIPASGSASETYSLKETLAQGFKLELDQDCAMCIESKGACVYNQTSRGVVCYCEDGNQGNSCGSGKKSHGYLVNVTRIVAGSVACAVLFLALLLLFIRFLRKREIRLRQQKLKALILLKHYTYAHVKRITNSFAEVVGRGGFGIVYRGTLSDGRMVAVKVLKDSKGNGEDFTNEVASMSQTSHLNIVSLLGFCAEGSKRAIIYEFLGNGSLDKFLSGKTAMKMDSKALYGIALGVARGLEYLHHGCKTRIVHFDIKPQNVLLDDNFCPKVSDFGLAKLCEKKESALSLLDTRGTIGYIAPEMISRVYGSVSHKSDVYSYGMLVLEMIGARNKERAHPDSASNSSSIYFPEWVYRDLEQKKSRRLMENGSSYEEDEIAKKMTLVGLWCIQSSPLDRPPMNRVVEMMEGSLDALEVPPRPVLQIPMASLQESSTLSENIFV